MFGKLSNHELWNDAPVHLAALMKSHVPAISGLNLVIESINVVNEL